MKTRRSELRLLGTVCALSLSACGPAPTGSAPAPARPTPVTSGGVTPASQTSASPAAVTAAGAYVVRLQADQALKSFMTQQQGPFSLCLGRISRASVSLKLPASGLGPELRTALEAAGVSISSGPEGTTLSLNRDLKLADLLAGVELRFPGLGGEFEGRLRFLDSNGAELGFVSWQNESSGRELSIALSPAGGTSAGESCPQIESRVSGGRFLGAGGQVTSSEPLPNPQTSPSPEPTASPSAGQAPGAPENAKVVEQTVDSLTLQWDFPSDARSFRLFLDGTQVAADHVTPNYYRFTSLRASTTYRLGVQSVNAAGQSEIITVTTATTSGGRSASGNFSSGGNGNTSKPSTTAGELDPGDQIEVDPATSVNENSHQIAINADGDYIVVWEASLNSPEDTGNGIYAQRFSFDGSPEGDRIHVNAFTSGAESIPYVALDDDGSFVITWRSIYGQNFSLYARQFDADGEPESGDLLVRTITDGLLSAQAVALDESGDFVVAWSELSTSSGYSDDIVARRYVADEGFESVFLVNSYTTGAQGNPDLAFDADGAYIVVWNGEGEEDSLGVHAQRFDEDDEAVGSPIPVSSDTDQQGAPRVAVADSGNFVVAWPVFSQPGSGKDVFAKRFRANGASLGDDFKVNTYTLGDQTAPAVALDADGNFTIVWQSRDQTDSKYSVYGQRYQASGREIDDEFLIPATETPSFRFPQIAMAPDGDFVVAYSTKYDENPSGISKIYTRNFAID